VSRTVVAILSVIAVLIVIITYHAVKTLNIQDEEKAVFSPFCHRYSERIFSNGFNQTMLEQMASTSYKARIRQDKERILDIHMAFADVGAYQQTLDMTAYAKLHNVTIGAYWQIECLTLFENKRVSITYQLQNENSTLYLAGVDFKVVE
jgi:hypothetical protein